MSVWLPRSRLVRSYGRTLYNSNSHLIVARSFPLNHHHAVLPRYQSSVPNPTSNPTQTVTQPSDPKAGPPAPKDPAQAPLSTRIWKKVKHEAQHYWHGTKLLVSEVRISSRLQWKILHGETLTRRERRQVCRI